MSLEKPSQKPGRWHTQIAPLPNEQQVHVKDLSSGEYRIRREAVNKISSKRHFGAVPHLIAALADKSDLVKHDAAAWLGKIRDKLFDSPRETRIRFAGTAEFAALKRFHPYHETERFRAYLEALGKKLDELPQSVPGEMEKYLAKLQSDDKDFRHEAVNEMGENPHPRLLLAAAKMLEDPHPYVRDEAARLVGLIGHPVGLEFLGAALLDERKQMVRNTIAASIGAIQFKNAMWPKAHMLNEQEIKHFDAGVTAHSLREAEEGELRQLEKEPQGKRKAMPLPETPEWLDQLDRLTGAKREIIPYDWLSEEAKKHVDEIRNVRCTRNAGVPLTLAMALFIGGAATTVGLPFVFAAFPHTLGSVNISTAMMKKLKERHAALGKIFHENRLIDDEGRSQAKISPKSRIRELKPNVLTVNNNGDVHLRRVPKRLLASILAAQPLKTMEQKLDNP